MNNALKNILKVITVMSAFVFITSFAYATSLNTPTNIPELQAIVKHNGSWGSYGLSKSVNLGDELVFQIHAYANGEDVIDLKARMDNLNQADFHEGQEIIVHSQVKANNATPESGCVHIKFNDNIKLVYVGYKWGVKNEIDSGKEQFKNIPNDQNGAKTLTPYGVDLGTLNQGYRSNLLIRFSAERK